MNAPRREQITKAIAMLEEGRTILEQAQAEEQDYYDNMPESLQGGEKGDKAQEASDSLSSAVDLTQEAIDMAQSSIES